MGHIHDKYDFVVVGIPVFEDKVLIIHHIKNQCWLHGVGGHVELDEDPEEALWREVEEECGLTRDDLEIISNQRRDLAPITDGKQIEPPYDIHVHQISDDHWHIALNYFMRAKTDKIKLAPNEHHDIRWVNRAELENYRDKMPPNAYQYALYALELAAEPTR